MFGRKTAPGDELGPLFDLVRHHMPGADEETARIVTSIAGLLAGVAYADTRVSPEEVRTIRSEIARVQFLGPQGVDAIMDALQADLVAHATTLAARYTRTLRDLADRDLRVQVLGALVDVAAADGHISADEVATLRRTATALGLDQDDYNRLQARHRDKLGLPASS